MVAGRHLSCQYVAMCVSSATHTKIAGTARTPLHTQATTHEFHQPNDFATTHNRNRTAALQAFILVKSQVNGRRSSSYRQLTLGEPVSAFRVPRPYVD